MKSAKLTGTRVKLTNISSLLVLPFLMLTPVNMTGVADTTSLTPPVVLPNGEKFKTWEAPLRFTRTYHVNPAHPKASDENPGTEDSPLRTINRAAQVLQPGERVVIAAGTHRERVAPARGGAGSDCMISYEAATGAQVILSGSQVTGTTWTASTVGGVRLWTTTLPQHFFVEENPFAEVNLTEAQIERCMDWAVPIKGHPTFKLRRGLVFQNGRRLRQVLEHAELNKTPGSYWVETEGLTLHLHPLAEANPNDVQIEVTTRGMVFAPHEYGLGYIRVKGLTIQHSGNCFPRPQQGALSTMRGHHWLIEDNTVRQCNAIGIDIGDQFDISGPALAEGGQHTVRRNRISDCGIGGLEGKQIMRTLIEDNIIRRCGWHDVWRLYETGGIKVHCTRSCVLRHNLVTDTIGAPGIWMDYANVNSRCTANVIVNADCSNGGIFMEGSQQPNMVDNNFVWGTRGSGIYQHDCDELIIAHNLVAYSADAAVRMQICQGRRVGGRLSTAKRNKILNNVFIENGLMLAISDADNLSDYNVFAGSKKPFDIAAWQAKGWDKHSVVGRIAGEFDAQTLEFQWTMEGGLPEVPSVSGVDRDLMERQITKELALPGPFATPASSRLQLLPRLQLRDR